MEKAGSQPWTWGEQTLHCIEESHGIWPGEERQGTWPQRIRKSWRHSMFSLPQFLLVRFAFRNPRPKTKGTTWSKEDFSSAEVKEHFNWTFLSYWALTGCTQECWGSLLITRPFLEPLEGQSEMWMFLRSGREQMSLLSSRWETRTIQAISHWSASPQSL